jgi:hypothetical protein
MQIWAAAASNGQVTHGKSVSAAELLMGGTAELTADSAFFLCATGLRKKASSVHIYAQNKSTKEDFI